MRKLKWKNLFPYIAATLFIACWWVLAFSHTDSVTPVTALRTPQNPETKNLGITPLHRDTLRKALAGNFTLMAKLIADWDVDAQLLEKQTETVFKRLPNAAYVNSQLLVRQLSTQSLPPKTIVRFLPQTYVAASFLLALTTPDQIVALPEGLRKQVHLFPKEQTNTILLDIDRYQGEKLFIAHPDIAFVSHYSHPATLEALRNQGIEIHSLPSISQLSDIYDTLKQIGVVSNRQAEAELLAIFIEAALLCIDNRLTTLNLNDHLPHILFLNCHHRYSTPTEKTLTGQLLNRMGLTGTMQRSSSSQEWTIPIEQEELIQLNPHCIIISTQNIEGKIREISTFRHTKAYQQQNIFFVDENVQDFGSQHIVLAYYDLYNALASARFP